MTTINVPDLSGATDVDVVEVFVSAGDSVAEGDSLIALETDKASMEIEADKAGVIEKVLINEGDTCNEGDVIVQIKAAGAAEAAPVAAVEAEVVPAPAPVVEAAPAAPAAVGGIEKVMVPDLSGATDVDVIEVMVKAGDQINEGDSLIALETDKASMEVPAPMGGTVISVSINEGDTCNEGDLLLELQLSGAEAAASAAVSPAPEVAQPAAAEAAPAPAAAPVAGGVEDVLVPDLSGASDVDVIEVMVSAGDEINEGDSLIALETDKASMEVPAPKGGVVKEVKIAEGATCNEGDVIPVLEVGPEAFAPPPKVDSAVVRLVPHRELPHPAKDLKCLQRVCTQAFSKRRKTIRNSLKGVITDEQLQQLAISPELRPEQITMAQYVAIANLVSDNPQ